MQLIPNHRFGQGAFMPKILSLENAIDDTKSQPAKSVQFKNRYDEYIEAIQ
jgi:hypothetical protein